MQLVGTISTSTANEKATNLRIAGWVLIIVGSLVEGGDLKIGDSTSETFDSKAVYEKLLADAKATKRNPEITSSKPISFAINAFEADSSLSYSEKARLFATTVLNADKKASEIKAQKAANPAVAVSLRHVAEDVLGRDASAKNVQIIERFLVLSGAGA